MVGVGGWVAVWVGCVGGVCRCGCSSEVLVQYLAWFNTILGFFKVIYACMYVCTDVLQLYSSLT